MINSIKFTNVKYYVGGGKVPLRIRTNQNITLYFREKPEIDDQSMIDNLFWITKGRCVATLETKVVRK